MYEIIKGKEGVMFSNGTVLNAETSQDQLAEIFEWQKDELVKFVKKASDKKVIVSD